VSKDTSTLTLPFSPQVSGTLLLVAGLALASALIYVALGGKDRPDPIIALRERMGLTGLPPGVVFFLCALWGLLFATLLGGIFYVIYSIAHRIGAVTKAEVLDLRWYLLSLTAITAALGAVIALPFTLIRTNLNRRQTETAEQGLITDRITRAVEGLGAEKVVKVVNETPRYRTDARGEWLRDDDGNPIPATHPDGTPIIDRSSIETTAPNLEVRIGAIYALERIAKDSDRDHVQIMEILCAYIRQNAPASDAVEWPEIEMQEDETDGSLHDDWDKRVKAFEAKQQALKADLTCRTDIQTALTVIGRRSAHQRLLEARAGHDDSTVKFVFDTPCPEPPQSLQDGEYDPEALTAYQAELNKWKENLRTYTGFRLDLRRCNLHGADLPGLNLRAARFDEAQMQAAGLYGARMQGARLYGTLCDSNTSFIAATLRDAAMKEVNCNNLPRLLAHAADFFADASVETPDGFDRPNHWPRFVMYCEEFGEQWRKWLANPNSYTPPSPPDSTPG